MRTKIIQAFEGQLKIGSWDVANCLAIEHPLVVRLIKLYLPDWQEIPAIRQRSSRQGAQVKDFLLDEFQLRLLLIKCTKASCPDEIKRIVWMVFKNENRGAIFFAYAEDMLTLIKEKRAALRQVTST